VLQSGRREFGQPLGERHRGGIRQAKRSDVGHLVQLSANRLIQSRVRVAVDVAPQIAHAVQELSAINIDQRTAVSPLDQQRLVLGHLRKGVPDDLAVPAS